ncbi:Flp pilus assembly complex ATPase component TadA [Candidatus Woesearchaeota archaeon]|nr:Flp pilus assembly complex ATPase component TadA [Candidatus Woesearchaeota archaeon]
MASKKKSIHKKTSTKKSSQKNTSAKTTKKEHKKILKKINLENNSQEQKSSAISKPYEIKPEKPESNAMVVNKQEKNKNDNQNKPLSYHVEQVAEQLDEYQYNSGQIPIRITIKKDKREYVPIYDLEIASITPTTKLILEKIRQELIKKVSLGIADLSDSKKTHQIEEKFEELIKILIEKYLPDSDMETTHFLTSYLKIKSLGLGNIELIMDDQNLEEIVINQASEPIWIYHKHYGWLKTTTYLKDENQIRHYASIIGRKVGRQITVLTPLLDANLDAGDRVNATLSPVSTDGNTITIRKFSRDPWTITKFLRVGTISAEAAAVVWSAIQYEMSALIAGGTASGKTSALNVFAGFSPPNQRILSIEDTREIRLPKFLHWVPMNTVMPNAEGKGEISMGNLLVNSLRMRPDRILVGEVRRKQETETLFEAIHTGHSVYATFHANNAREAIDRLTNPPLDVPKIMLPAISLIIVQFRNRRTGKRRTFQIAEIMPNGEPNVILQYDAKKDVLVSTSGSMFGSESSSKKGTSHFFETINNFTGMSIKEIKEEITEKVKVLNYLVKHNIDSVDGVGRVMAEYYTDKDNLMKYVNSNKEFPHM